MGIDDERRDKMVDAFISEPMMRTIQVTVEELAQGRATLRMPFAELFEQRAGFQHPGVTATLADGACSLAARTIREDREAYTLDMRINHLAPSTGSTFQATAEVTSTYGPLAYCTARVAATRPDGETSDIASVEATIALLAAR